MALGDIGDGRDEGSLLGTIDGIAEGKKDGGVKEGNSMGDTVGSKDGVEVRVVLGDTEGRDEGSVIVGNKDGFMDGSDEGGSDFGLVLGDDEYTTEGRNVLGATVGSNEDAKVGVTLGSTRAKGNGATHSSCLLLQFFTMIGSCPILAVFPRYNMHRSTRLANWKRAPS